MNKLAEYIRATPRRRRRLIVDQINPPAFKVAIYDDARRVLVRYFCDPTRTPRNLLESSTKLRDRAADPSNDDHQRKALLSSARAVEAFIPIADQVRSKGMLAVPGTRRNETMEIAGLRVVVAPDISFLQRGTEARIGCLKFHISNSTRLDVETLQYASALMFYFLQANGGTPKRGDCRAVDVFGAIYETVPKAIKDRMKNIEAACEEIAERWPSLVEAESKRESFSD